MKIGGTKIGKFLTIAPRVSRRPTYTRIFIYPRFPINFNSAFDPLRTFD